MRGQQTIVAIVLITTIGLLLAVTYYMYVQGLFFHTKSDMQRMMDEYTDLSKRYIEISSAIAKIDESANIVHLLITITNTGGSDIPLYSASVYVYKDDVLVTTRPVSLANLDCSNPFPSGYTCIIPFDVVSSEYSSPEDIYNSYLIMYINDSRKRAKIEYAGKVPGDALYAECHSCIECSSLLSSVEPGSIVVASISEPANGNCVEISGARDVTMYCGTKLVGNGTGTGILIEDSEDVSIRGCEVENFEYGVFVHNSQNLSFGTAYFHNNTIDIAFDKDTLGDICTLEFADISTSSGYIYLATGNQGTVPVLGASALWLIGTSESTFNGQGMSLSRVSPAVALCNTSSVSVTSFDIENTDVGVSIIGDSGTHLDYLDVQSNIYGVYSRLSSNGRIYNSTFNSGVGDVFDAASNMEWGPQTTFAG